MQADGTPDPSYRMKKNQQGQYIPLSQSEGQFSLAALYTDYYPLLICKINCFYWTVGQ